LENIPGSGKDGRITKEDILNHIKNRGSQPAVALSAPKPASTQVAAQAVPVSVNGGDEIVEMDRMRKLISGYMVASVQTSAHVQSFIEVDVTNIVKWRDRVKNAFEKREGEKLTYTPIFMEAVAKALKDFPGMNISVDGDFIIKRKNINLGMAAALPNGNLIVPVIKNADQLNLVGMAKAVNDLGNRAKAGKLKPDDTQGGTYTVTNVGTFGSVFGTPIINQPQVGILALGAIRKVPAVIETLEGDFIGIRQKMFLSHSYDHRVVDGALGGSFVKRVAEYLEAFDANREY
jgi:2-oxoglutarate dehydrogenase E2 component (dihydrolipoamide succinyltransferase)